MSKIYKSTKTYGHNLGLSVAFRQWKAESHCSFLHGYALEVALEFSATTLDSRNWVVDFGSLKPVKEYLYRTFDHKTIVAQDDPKLDYFYNLNKEGIIDMKVVPKVGCEAFADMIHDWVSDWLRQVDPKLRCSLSKVEVREHGANSAIIESTI